MAPSRKNAPFAETWACEFCGAVTYGVSPPDECEMCTNRYFDNLQDILTEAGESGDPTVH